ncbi:ABC transporter ATP-binding protein [Pusillimonas sp.]|uniref:ABC transporter ATP-binding protein n=1 Tax=Pusillimonas sp. TaxID=3040095 RepID=UPI0037C5CF50
MSTPVLEFRDVSVTVKAAGTDVALLRKVSFMVRQGQVLGLVGESGAGKSMIGRVVSGLLPENLRFAQGQVLFRGEPFTRRQAQSWLGRRIAFIPQEPLSALNPVLTIRQQFFEHLKHQGRPRKQWESYATDRLAEVGLPTPSDMLDRYAHQLSGGQCQRVLIAMAFSGDPELIIADEPTTALDVITQAQIIRLLKQVQQRHNTAVVLITHDLRMAAHVCDEVAVLYAGDVVERGPAGRVLDTPMHPYSWALKLATPNLDGPQYVLATLPELMPGPREMAAMPGCRFASRCPTSDETCAQQPPMLEEVKAGHFVGCAGSCRGHNSRLQTLPHHVPESQNLSGRPLLHLVNASRVYRRNGSFKQPEFHALRPLSLSIYPGELVGIVGESGSGKSTLARILVGLVEPSRGKVLVNGIDRAEATSEQSRQMRTLVQMVFQDPDSALNPRRTVERLITQVLEIQPNISPATRVESAAKLMKQVGMAADALGRFPSQLSGGQKQRVNIARALCATPQVLVADEIVSGLDVSVQALILNLMLALNRELGIAVVLISHDLSVVRYLCQRVLVMHKGEVVEQGKTRDVFGSPQHPYTRSLLAAVPPDDMACPWPPEDVISPEPVAQPTASDCPKKQTAPI